MAARERQIPNVRTWSKTVPAHDLDLRDLDVYVLKEHHDIVRAMGRERSLDRRELVDLGIVLLTMIAPLSGVLVRGDAILPRRSSEEGLAGSTAATFSAWCLALAVPGLLAVGWRWWRSRRHWAPLDVAGVALTALAGVVVLRAMADDGVDVLAPALVSVPAWAALVLAVVLGGAVAAASRGRRQPFGRNFRVVGDVDVEGVRRLVDGLDPARHRKLLDERRRAIGRLRDRGIADERDLSRVEDLSLGRSPTLRD